MTTPAYVPPTSVDPRDKETPDEWVMRSQDMVRLTGLHPFNAEAPLPMLIAQGFYTPNPLHYVRNHGQVPKIDPDTHTVTVSGLVAHPRPFTMKELRQLPSVAFPVSLSCAGNRRKEQNMVKQSNGFSWGPAAVSCAVWKGVLLKDLLELCGVNREARWVNFSGPQNEYLPKGFYGTSVALDYCMTPSNDCLVAYEMNGEPLPPDHGFPVRMILPGFIGGRMVKWLSSITVTNVESESFYHYQDNRVLPPPVLSAEQALAEKWWWDRRFIINERNINSAIANPIHNEIVPLTDLKSLYKLKGYAYSGGGREIIRVELSFDAGKTWELTNLTYPETPRHGTKFWCWWLWEFDVQLVRLARAQTIMLRAWDNAQNTQPETLTWNLLGMMNNPWYRVKIHTVFDDKSNAGLKFEHPTQPGAQPGGWMTPQRIPDSPFSAAASSQPAPKPKEEKPATDPSKVKLISSEEVAKHKTADDCWIIIDGKVYDVTKFLHDHPGGARAIAMVAGKDASEMFNAIHSDRARKIREQFYIGDVAPSSSKL